MPALLGLVSFGAIPPCLRTACTSAFSTSRSSIVFLSNRGGWNKVGGFPI